MGQDGFRSDQVFRGHLSLDGDLFGSQEQSPSNYIKELDHRENSFQQEAALSGAAFPEPFGKFGD